MLRMETMEASMLLSVVLCTSKATSFVLVKQVNRYFCTSKASSFVIVKQVNRYFCTGKANSFVLVK